MSDISFLTIYNPHTGDSYKISKPVRFQNLPSFKSYLQELLNIENKEDIFLLTSFGIKLNFSLINELYDIYVFDKRLFTSNTSVPDDLYSKVNMASIVKPTPSSLQASDMNVKSITSAIKNNSIWSNTILKNSLNLNENIKQLIKQINIIFKSLNIIFQFGTNFINDIEKKFNIDFNHVKLISLKSLHKSWKEHYKKLKKFSTLHLASSEFDAVNLLNVEELQSSADYVAENLPKIVDKFNEMSSSINKVNEMKLNIDKKIETLRNESIHTFKDLNASSSITIIQELSATIDGDIDKLSANTPVDLEQIFNLHKNDYCINLYKTSMELYNFHEKLIQFKAKIFRESIEIFNKIASLQFEIVLVKNELKSLTNPNENKSSLSYENINKIRKAEDHLSLCIDLPLLLGFVLIEKRRQFEWQDFFSKGIINNSSEQFTSLIDNERLFRKIWIKKFGAFLKFLSKEPMEIPLPHLDITIINPQVEDKTKNFLSNSVVERNDILNFIEILEKNNYSSHYVNLLHKNFKDLVKSTDNMKNITKIISSISLQNSDDNGKMSLKLSYVNDNEGDDDLSLVKGLKTRIKKLENLLHQQQYKDLSNWPVTRNNSNIATDVRKSIMLQGTLQNSAPKMNPTLLLKKTQPQNSKENVGSSSVLDGSVVDKHLDNIRLKKENYELSKKLEERQINHDKELLELKVELDELKSRNMRINESFNLKIEEKEREIDEYKKNSISIEKELNEINKKYIEKENEITELHKKIKSSNELYGKSSNDIINLNDEINKLRQELKDTNDIKHDLLSDVSSKEVEFGKERNELEMEINDLKTKFDNLNDDYENLLKLTETKEKNNTLLINDLNNTIISLMGDIRRVSNLVYEYFVEFCYVLESSGLLLVKDNHDYKITRVKGLRLKKNETDSQKIIEKLSSTVISEVDESMKWIQEILSIKSILPEETSNSNEETKKFSKQSVYLLSTFNRIFTSEYNEFEKFLKLISFTENIQLQENSDYSERFFLNAISKRFKDIEGFAKKQTKDNKVKSQELSRLLSRNKQKISMNDFQIEDLVLFLPTRIDGVIDSEVKQPWAAFNIGAPHYFLNNTILNDKDWMLGRVTNIVEHIVTESNFTDKELNPFQLSVGVKWFLVDAKEEYA